MLKLSQLDRALKHEEMLDRSRDRAKYPQPEPAAPAYIEGVNIDRLKESLTFLGAAYDSDEMLAARMAEHVNRLTQCVMASKVLLADAAPSVAPTAPESKWSEPELWAEIYRLRAALKGPAGFDTWQDAATDERIRRVRAERALAAPSVAPEPVAWLWEHPTANYGGPARQLAFNNDTAFEDWKQTPLFAHPPRAPLTVEEAIYALVSALGESKGWLRDYSDAVIRDAIDRNEPRAPLPETLHTFLNAAAGEGLVLDGVDAADLYIALFPERYAAAVNSIDSGAAK